MTTAHRILGVSPGCSTIDIKKAYRRLVLKFHPDKNVGQEQYAHEAFIKVQSAYEELMTSGLRTSPSTPGESGSRSEDDASAQPDNGPKARERKKPQARHAPGTEEKPKPHATGHRRDSAPRQRRTRDWPTHYCSCTPPDNELYPSPRYYRYTEWKEKLRAACSFISELQTLMEHVQSWVQKTRNLPTGSDRKDVLTAIRNVGYWIQMAQWFLGLFAADARFVHGVGEADSSRWQASMATVHWYATQVDGFVAAADGTREWLKTFITDFMIVGRLFDGEQRAAFVQRARDVAPILLVVLKQDC